MSASEGVFPAASTAWVCAGIQERANAIDAEREERDDRAPHSSRTSPRRTAYRVRAWAYLALHRILRRAMGRAGLVSGYRHRCRRKGCGYGEERADAVNSTCPKCSMKLWVSAIPRPIRFHSTRHTTATLLLKAKVPLAVVQRVLRHSDPNITARVYGHLDIDDMRDGVNVLGTAVGPHLKLVGDK